MNQLNVISSGTTMSDLCCYMTEREHPTWPVYSDHPFGAHTLVRGGLTSLEGIEAAKACSLCTKTLNDNVRAARELLQR